MSYIRIFILIIAALAASLCHFDVSAYEASYYSSSSVLAEGRWVKIKVTETGMQQVTAAQLAAMGFDDPSEVTVFGYGGSLLADHGFAPSLPDDLPQQPVIYLKDKIVFYGEADVVADYNKAGAVNVRRNNAATAGFYFLTDSRRPMEIIPQSNRPDSVLAPRTTHLSLGFIEEEVTNPRHAGAHFFGRDFAGEPVQQFSLYMPDIVSPATQEAHLFLGGVLAGSAPSFEITFPSGSKRKVSGLTTTGIDLAYFYYVSMTSPMTVGEVSADDCYPLTVSTASSRLLSYGAVDKITYSYMRHNRYGDHRQFTMVFRNMTPGTPVVVSEASGDVRVWNVSSPARVTPLATDVDAAAGTVTADMPDAGDDCIRLAVFDPSRELNKVEFAGNVSNQNLHAASTPDMIILSTPECMAQAERLADAHRRYQSMSVIVVDQTTVFNEFSSGTPSLMAVRRFAKMFYDRDPEKFRHLLLFGGASYDNRAIESAVADHFDRFLLVYEVESFNHMGHGATAYASDAYFGMLEDNYDHSYILSTPMSINVGRIPAIMASNAVSAVDKIIDYLAEPPSRPVWSRALIMADGGDRHSHMNQADALCDTITTHAPATNVLKCYNALYPLSGNDAKSLRDKASRSLNSGVGFFAYMGHGAAVGFSANNLWSRLHAQTVDYDHPPFTMFSTCDTYAFDRNENGIAEHMVYKRNGGSIGVIAAGRTVYKDYNQYFNTAVGRTVFSMSPDGMTGDIYRLARNRLISLIRDPEIQLNTMCYNFCGDPALPLYIPSGSVGLDAGSPTSLFPLAPNTLEGYVTDRDGNVDRTFNGTLTAVLYEPGDSIETIKQGNYSDLPTRKIYCRETTVSETAATVTNGRFSVDIKFPLQSKSGDNTRLSLYATSDDRPRSALGAADMVLAGYDASLAIDDSDAPVIDLMYVNDPDFADGDIVTGDIVLHATILPDATGINRSALSIEGALKVVVDGERTIADVQNRVSQSPDGSAVIKVPVSGLNDGRHSLTLSLADNSGNRASRTVSFVVINRPADAFLEVDETPAVSVATLSLFHSFPGEPQGRLVIEDADGNTVLSVENASYPYVWKLTDGNGSSVADGRYSAYAILRDGLRYAATPRQEIVVIRNSEKQ